MRILFNSDFAIVLSTIRVDMRVQETAVSVDATKDDAPRIAVHGKTACP